MTMLRKTIVSIAVATALTGGFGFNVAHAGNAQALQRYDFAYLQDGDPSVRPVQVFSDESYTYFQFRRSAVVPAIYSLDGGGKTLLVPEPEGAYLKVPRGARFRLEFDKASATVNYSGMRMAAAPRMQVQPAAAPVYPDFPFAGQQQAASAPSASLQAPVAMAPAMSDLQRTVSGASLGAATVGGSTQPEQVGGEVSLDLDAPSKSTSKAKPAAESNTSLLVRFAEGSDKLGPKGRADVTKLAAQAKGAGQQLVLVVYGDSDDDSPKEQAKQRGRAIRAELAAHGVKNVRFEYGGEKDIDDKKLVWMKASFKSASGEAETATPTRQNVASSQAQVSAQPVFTSNGGYAPAPKATTLPVEDVLALNNDLIQKLKTVDEMGRSGTLSENQVAEVKARIFQENEAKKQRRIAELQAGIDTRAKKTSNGCQFVLTPQDVTVRRGLERWASEAGWQAPIWDLDDDPLVDVAASFCKSKPNATFEDAVASLMDTLNAFMAPNGHPVKAVFHSNKALVLTGGNK